MSITTPLFHHHKHCDEMFASAEDAVANGQWPTASEALAAFASELTGHFSAEEDVLFPAFERATGMSAGPTQVMRFEHGQMRELLGEMQRALGERDADGYAGIAETLLVLMQQHNMKEENILYPMCDNAVTGREIGDAIEQRLSVVSCPA